MVLSAAVVWGRGGCALGLIGGGVLVGWAWMPEGEAGL